MSTLSSKIIKSSLQTYGYGGLSKALSLISTAILARILTPDDFGLVAATFSILSLFSILTTLGAGPYLIKKNEILDCDLQAAWWLRLVIGLISAAVIILISGYIGDYFGDKRIEGTLKVMTIGAIIGCLGSTATIILQKEMNFSAINRLDAVSNAVQFVSVIALAIFIGNYWAFVISYILYNIAMVLGSYVIAPFKPKYSVNKVREQWDFSKWVISRNILGYLSNKIDVVFAQGSYGTEKLGLYSNAALLGSLPGEQIISPIFTVLYSGFSRSVGDDGDLVDKILKSLMVLCILVFPLAFGMYYLSELIVLVVFGDKWLQMTPLLQIFSLLTIVSPVNILLSQIFLLKDRVKMRFKFEIFVAFISVIALYLAAKNCEIVDYSLVKVILVALMIFGQLALIKTFLNIKYGDLYFAILPPAFISIIMIIALKEFLNLISVYGSLLTLLLSVGFGAVVYVIIASAYVAIGRRYSDKLNFIYQTIVIPLKKMVAAR